MKTWPTLLSADAARARFAEHFRPVPAIEEIETEAALGRVLAADLSSPEDLPPFRRSLMDGYAVQAGDTAAAPAVLLVVGEVRMGEIAAVALRSGEAARVPTGGMLPAGADAVVPVEATERGRPLAGSAVAAPGSGAAAREWVTVLEPITPGRHLIERGEDVRRGE